MKYSSLLLILLLCGSCKKVFDSKLDDFNVKLVNTPLKVGDTAYFVIEGNPDFITFYSGENGNNYDYRNRTVADSSDPQLSFTSNVQNLSPLHSPALSLLVSTDYNGDTLNILNSNWTDISNRAVFSSGTANTPSGIIKLGDFKNKENVYIAFRYNTDSAINATQPTWTIQSFNLNNLSFPDSTLHELVTIANTGWQVADFSNAPRRWVVASNQLSLAGGPALGAANKDWVITKLFLNRVNPDAGISLKQISEKVSSYQYFFSKAGKYKVVFVARNANFSSEKEIVKQIEIDIK